jgi:2-oxoglutarate/2-oxoacid ferredoxin oxidoreductase subunit beta
MSPETLTKQDFVGKSEVKWCPGCGDYAILSAVQTVLPTLGIPKEKICFISGIGCSSRFPYYMNTFGFHTIHGRATTVASGLKMSDPTLSVWVVTGDGDGLSIGGNHTMHTIRRNMDLKILLFNNRIYGLTKGQYSPTSEKGKITKTSPLGSIDNALNPVSFAIASGATFVARANAVNPKHLQAVLVEAASHRGTAFIEILQNCNIFNDGAFSKYNEKETKDQENLFLQTGKPLHFDDGNKGICLRGDESPNLIIESAESEYSACSASGHKFLVHDPSNEDPTLAYLIGQMGIENPNLPTAMGVIRKVSKPTYGDLLLEQEQRAKSKRPKASIHDLLYSKDTWQVN